MDATGQEESSTTLVPSTRGGLVAAIAVPGERGFDVGMSDVVD
jgi:hypothetical protein